GLPSDTEGKAWASVYRQSDLLTFAPCDVLDKNPDNLNHRLNQGGSGNGREKENAKEKKDNSKVITLAIATVASSVNGDFDGSKAPTGTSTPLTTPVVTASGPFINFVLQPHVRARYKLEFAPGVKGSTTSDLDIFFSK
ncbi:Proteophosphoglycan ppg4, partial [Rhodotorula toruloides]